MADVFILFVSFVATLFSFRAFILMIKFAAMVHLNLFWVKLQKSRTCLNILLKGCSDIVSMFHKALKSLQWSLLEKVGVIGRRTSSFCLFSSDFLSSLCFPTCSLTAKIPSTNNLRKTAFSIMSYAWLWMRTKFRECLCRWRFCFFNVCMTIWPSVTAKARPFALSMCDACTAWTVCRCLWKCNSNIMKIRVLQNKYIIF